MLEKFFCLLRKDCLFDFIMGDIITTRLLTSTLSSLTCNCLLTCPTSRGESPQRNGETLFSACYNFSQASDASSNALHSGCVEVYECQWDESHGGSFERKYLAMKHDLIESNGLYPLPGIFDIITCNDGYHFFAACTDGSARILHIEENSLRGSIFPVHQNMLTSCSPFFTSPGEAVTASKWICTVHGGSTVVYDPVPCTILNHLESHEYDAWCSATMDTTTALSGGDDSFLKYWDLRSGNSPVYRMRFDAGVVSISPVAEGARSTSYSLVGSYDENLYLVDSRFTSRPVASVALGGGVWRCARQVSTAKLSHNEKMVMRNHRWVQVCNTLAVPVMQRGVTFVQYDIRGSEADIFRLLGHLHSLEGESCTSVNPKLPENALFYDCAVLKEPDLAADTSTVLATCDFYNNRIAMWEIQGIHCTS